METITTPITASPIHKNVLDFLFNVILLKREISKKRKTPLIATFYFTIIMRNFQAFPPVRLKDLTNVHKFYTRNRVFLVEIRRRAHKLRKRGKTTYALSLFYKLIFNFSNEPITVIWKIFSFLTRNDR